MFDVRVYDVHACMHDACTVSAVVVSHHYGCVRVAAYPQSVSLCVHVLQYRYLDRLALERLTLEVKLIIFLAVSMQRNGTILFSLVALYRAAVGARVSAVIKLRKCETAIYFKF